MRLLKLYVQLLCEVGQRGLHFIHNLLLHDKHLSVHVSREDFTHLWCCSAISRRCYRIICCFHWASLAE